MALLGYTSNAQQIPAEKGENVPHPWIATAPPAVARLIDKGQVRIVTDDEQLAAAGKKGLTLFRFQIDYRHRFQLTATRPSQDDPSQVQGDIVARIQSVRVETRHTVVLESTYQPANPWEAPLVRHEFDHVSISTDPRFLKIAKQVLSLPVRCSVTWVRTDGLANQAVDEAIKGEISARIAELERIVQTGYDALDRETGDGQAILGERMGFFQTLYSVPWLRQIEFAYLDSIRVPMQDSANKEVLEHYLFVD